MPKTWPSLYTSSNLVHNEKSYILHYHDPSDTHIRFNVVFVHVFFVLLRFALPPAVSLSSEAGLSLCCARSSFLSATRLCSNSRCSVHKLPLFQAIRCLYSHKPRLKLVSPSSTKCPCGTMHLKRRIYSNRWWGIRQVLVKDKSAKRDELVPTILVLTIAVAMLLVIL